MALGASTKEIAKLRAYSSTGSGEGPTGSLLTMAAPPYAAIGAQYPSYSNKPSLSAMGLSPVLLVTYPCQTREQTYAAAHVLQTLDEHMAP